MRGCRRRVSFGSKMWGRVGNVGSASAVSREEEGG
jgi:hypothetical protein